MSLRDLVLAQFEPAIATALIEFGKRLSDIDADVVVFMARKSLCLYDVLLKLGVPPIERVVVSDRILDMDLAPLKGKRVALVDDTLILGTTLARAKKRLLDATGREPLVHAFCADGQWWSRELVSPDSIGLELTDSEVMTFCTGVVRSLGLLPRPYLVDFPLSSGLRVRPGDLQSIMSSTEWVTCDVSSTFQRQHDVFSMTLFPTSTVLDEWAESIGPDVLACCDLVKARMFGRSVNGVYWVQFVPIVTLKPMESRAVDELLDSFLARIWPNPADREAFRRALSTGISRQRAVQYLLSCALGRRLFKSVRDAVDTQAELTFDLNEAGRHYGPWLEDSLMAIHARSEEALWSRALLRSESGLISAKSVTVPTAVQQSADQMLERLRQVPDLSATDKNGPPEPNRNVGTTLTEVFLELFSSREMPARELVKSLGAKALTPSPEEQKHLDRLDTGIPWSSLLVHLQAVLRVEMSDSTSNAFSLAVDQANDLGVLVPITCECDGVVFRAYRHGEDVRFADSELALAYDTIKGFLDHSARVSVPRLVLEKLLVLLIKCGAANGFLEPYYGTSGAEGIARIAFHLQGAVPVITHGSRDRADRDLWLTRYLVKRRVIGVNSDGTYALGRRPDGHYLRSNAPGQAYELGALVGMLVDAKLDGHSPLGQSDLILLATCGTPRHTAAALEVELRIFSEWYTQTLEPVLQETDWNNLRSLRDLRRTLLKRSGGHEAVHGVRLKYVGYRAGAPSHCVQRCEDFLRQGGELNARRWSALWSAAVWTTPDESDQFDPLIDEMAMRAWEMSCALGLLELVIAARVQQIDSSPENGVIERVVEKISSYSESMVRAGVPDSTLAKRITSRMLELQQSGFDAFDFAAAVRFVGEKVQDRLPHTDALAERVGLLTDVFGRLVGRHDYSYLVHYDLIDSTGNEAGLKGKDLEQYRARVRNFKRLINQVIYGLGIQGKKQSTEIYCWNGDKSSTNDEKHIFVSGKLALRFSQKVIAELLEGAHALRLRIRVLIVPCNFAGTSAYRMEDQTEVHGERFWEHYSRVSRQAKSREPKDFKGDGFVVIVTDKVIADLKLAPRFGMRDSTTFVAESEIELLTRRTTVSCGVVQIQ